MNTTIRCSAGLLLTFLCLLVLCPITFAEEGRAWTWLSSNDKYSKFYDPASVRVCREVTDRFLQDLRKSWEAGDLILFGKDGEDAWIT